MKQTYSIQSLSDMNTFSCALAAAVTGPMVIELIGDIGAGKTTLVKGLAGGFGINENIQSPTFTISHVYDVAMGRGVTTLAHYDFYRLTQPGILLDELQEVSSGGDSLVVIEWGETVRGVLPDDRVTVQIEPVENEQARRLVVISGGSQSELLCEQLMKNAARFTA